MLSPDTVVTKHPYSVKSVKQWNTWDGGGLSCNIYLDGKKVGEAMDDGNGGGYNYRFWAGKDGMEVDRVAEQEFYDYAKSLGKYDYAGPYAMASMDYSPDLFMEDMVLIADMNSKAKKNLVYLHDGEDWHRGIRRVTHSTFDRAAIDIALGDAPAGGIYAWNPEKQGFEHFTV